MRLERQQQIAAYVLSALAVVAFVTVGSHVKVHLAVGLALASIMAALAQRGLAMPTAAASLGVSFGPWNTLAILGSPYIGFAFWVMLSASRRSKELKAATRAAGADAPPAPGAPPRERRPPTRSKRYTPPARRRPNR